MTFNLLSNKMLNLNFQKIMLEQIFQKRLILWFFKFWILLKSIFFRPFVKVFHTVLNLRTLWTFAKLLNWKREVKHPANVYHCVLHVTGKSTVHGSTYACLKRPSVRKQKDNLGRNRTRKGQDFRDIGSGWT